MKKRTNQIIKVISMVIAPILNPILNRVSICTIRTIDLEPIAACNLKCEFCQVPGWHRASETKAMDIGLFKHIIGQFPRLKYIKLQGMGEPFLNKEITEMVRYSTARRIKTSIITNGTLLNQKLNAELLEAGLTNLTFSFDGATKKTYESARKGSNYDKVVSNIQSFCQLKQKKRAKIRVGLTCLASTEEVLNEVPSLVKLASQLGVPWVHVKGRLKQWKKLEHKGEFRFESFCLDNYPQYEAIVKQAGTLARRLGIRFTYGNRNSSSYSYSDPCRCPWETLFVSTEGKVVPCCAIGIPDTWSMGDLKKDNIKDIWNNDAYRQLRRQIKLHKIPDICKSCYKDS